MVDSKSPGNLKGSIIPIVVTLVSVLFTQALAFVSSSETKYFSSLNRLAFFTILVQWIVFIHASGILGNPATEKYFDLTGSITYLLTLGLSYLKLTKPSIRQSVATAFAAVWSLRLGWFLFTRIHNNNGVDRRFTELKQSVFMFLQVWTLQGVWVFITLLALLSMNQSKDTNPPSWINVGGMALWAIGFAFEVVADMQKRWFRAGISNKGKWISSGLWSISRHPNYFGEITLWFGIYLISFNSLKSWKQGLLNLMSPLFVALLLIYVSGIPMLEKHADQLYGHLKEYREYKANTPVLIPFIGRRGNASF